jgi:hypothetical protein
VPDPEKFEPCGKADSPCRADWFSATVYRVDRVRAMSGILTRAKGLVLLCR